MKPLIFGSKGLYAYSSDHVWYQEKMRTQMNLPLEQKQKSVTTIYC